MFYFKKPQHDLFAVHEHEVYLSDYYFTFYELSNGLNVFSLAHLVNLLTTKQPEGEAVVINLNSKFQNCINEVQSFLPFLFIPLKINRPVVFKKNDSVMQGIKKEDLEILFKAFLKARKANKLPHKCLKIAGMAEQYFHFQKSAS